MLRSFHRNMFPSVCRRGQVFQLTGGSGLGRSGMHVPLSVSAWGRSFQRGTSFTGGAGVALVGRDKVFLREKALDILF